jgi:hypothetical protein
MKPMVKGEIAIIIDRSFTVYHPECYKKEREETLKGQGILREEWLEDASLRINDFVKASNPEAVKNLQVFYDAWGKLMLVPQLLKAIVSDAQRMAVIGSLHDYKLSRRINNNYRAIAGLAEEYRDGFGQINVQIKNREMFPVYEFPTPKVDPLSKLREEEKRSLASIVDSMKAASTESKQLLEIVRGISRKLTAAEKKEIRKQIEDVDKKAQPLP